MRRIEITISGLPKATPRPRSGKRGSKVISYMPKEYTEYKQQIATVIAENLKEHEWKWIVNGARVSIEFVFPRPAKCPQNVKASEWKSGGRVRRLSKPDCDNLWKGYVDAMTFGVNENLGFAEWDDCMAEMGPSNRWYAAINETAHAIVAIEPLEDMYSLLKDLQHANEHNYAVEARRALVALEQHIPAGDIRWHSLLGVAAKFGVNIPLTA